MISADLLRKKTVKIAKKKYKTNWKKIKRDIKRASDEGEFQVRFYDWTLNEEFIEILMALGYAITKFTSDVYGNYYYVVSWEHPLEYWDDEKFEMD